LQSGLFQTPEYILTSGVTLLDPAPSQFLNTPAKNTTGLQSGITYLFSQSELILNSSFLSLKKNDFFSGLGAVTLSNELMTDSCIIWNFGYDFEMLRFGTNCKYYYQKTDNYSILTGFSTDLGVYWKWQELQSSLSITNIYPDKIEGIDLPSCTSLQFVYQAGYLMQLGFGIEMDENFPTEFNFSSKLQISRMLYLFTGYQTELSALSFGLKFKYHRSGLSYAVRNHPELKLTHVCAISYCW
jgi:hypothetical protein